MERLFNISMKGRIIKSLFFVVAICMNVIFAHAQTNTNDISEIVRIIMGGSTTDTQKKAADFNNDGIVNVADIVNFLNTTLRIKTGEVLSWPRSVKRNARPSCGRRWK